MGLEDFQTIASLQTLKSRITSLFKVSREKNYYLLVAELLIIFCNQLLVCLVRLYLSWKGNWKLQVGIPEVNSDYFTNYMLEKASLIVFFHGCVIIWEPDSFTGIICFCNLDIEILHILACLLTGNIFVLFHAEFVNCLLKIKGRILVWSSKHLSC